MFDRLLNMFINKDELDKRERSNLADDLEPARPGEVDPSILKTIEDAVPKAELNDNLEMPLKASKELHDDEAKEEIKEDNSAEKLRDELFKKFKLK